MDPRSRTSDTSSLNLSESGREEEKKSDLYTLLYSSEAALKKLKDRLTTCGLSFHKIILLKEKVDPPKPLRGGVAYIYIRKIKKEVNPLKNSWLRQYSVYFSTPVQDIQSASISVSEPLFPEEKQLGLLFPERANGLPPLFHAENIYEDLIIFKQTLGEAKDPSAVLSDRDKKILDEINCTFQEVLNQLFAATKSPRPSLLLTWQKITAKLAIMKQLIEKNYPFSKLARAVKVLCGAIAGGLLAKELGIVGVGLVACLTTANFLLLALAGSSIVCLFLCGYHYYTYGTASKPTAAGFFKNTLAKGRIFCETVEDVISYRKKNRV